ncbi:hypothetical protein [Actinoplanes sp. NPDC049681]|uniref:hypothetical protein n=1 Tax=Actinoplanes sp. NPDC049681 TaxID=3363905 RepID=UPI00379018A6
MGDWLTMGSDSLIAAGSHDFALAEGATGTTHDELTTTHPEVAARSNADADAAAYRNVTTDQGERIRPR